MARNTDHLPTVVLVTVICFVILGVGVFAVSSAMDASPSDTENGERVQTAVETQNAGTWYSIASDTGTDPLVVTSRGYAVNLTGANDSYVRSKQGIDFSQDDTWSVSLWARLDNDATAEEQTALSLNGRLVINYNQTSSEWVVWYYDDGSRDSYELSVTGPNQPANFTNIQVTSNETHLQVYRNNTLGDTANLTTSSIVDAPVTSENWNGRLEEVRTVDDVLSVSERQELVDNPVEPQPGTNRTARIMFDEPYESSQLVLFSGTELEQSNVTFSQGFEGRQLTEGQYAVTADYTWNENGPRIRLLEGGSADDIPVAYVDYTKSGIDTNVLVEGFTAALALAALAPILLIVGYIVMTMDSRSGI